MFETTERDGQVYITADEEAIKTSRKQPNISCQAAAAQSDKVVIVGGGSAAIGAIEGLRENGYTGGITVVSSEGNLPIDRPKLSKALLADLSKLQFRNKAWFEGGSVKWVDGQVTSVDFSSRSVATQNGEKHDYTKLILATGGRARTLPVQGFPVLENIFTLRSVSDVRAIVDAIGDKGKKIVIVGASFIGMEVANATCKDNDVTVIDMTKTPLERVLGDKVGAGIQKAIEGKGVKFHMGAGISKAEPSTSDPAKVGAVVLKDGTSIPADMVILGVGVSPATDYLKDNAVVRLESDGSLSTDENFQVAGLKDVYAVGDIATFPYHGPGGDGKPVRIEHWNVAQNAGRHAAMHIVNSTQKRTFGIPIFWSALGAQMRYCGNISNGWDDLVLQGDPAELKFVAYYTKGDTVVAMASMGKDPLMVQSSELMRIGKMPGKQDLHSGVDVMTVAI